MVIKNVLDPKQLERSCDQENRVWRIAALDDSESVFDEDSPRQKKLPKERCRVLDHVSEGAVTFLGHRMPINTYVVDHLI